MSALYWLLASHFVCDYPLQGDFLAANKARRTSSTVPGLWLHCLTAHAFIQGAGVALVTGSIWLGLAETVAHWLIDFGKCEGRYGFTVDQSLHIACKVIWALLLAWGAA